MECSEVNLEEDLIKQEPQDEAHQEQSDGEPDFEDVVSRGKSCLICLSGLERPSDSVPWNNDSANLSPILKEASSLSKSLVDNGEGDVGGKDGRGSFRNHLSAVFILHNLLSLPKEKCAGVLEKTRENLGDWFSLCERCSKLIRVGFEIHLQVLRLERKLERIRKDLQTTLKSASGKRRAEEEDAHKDSDGGDKDATTRAHYLIRECFSDASRSCKKSQLRSGRKKARRVGLPEKSNLTPNVPDVKIEAEETKESAMFCEPISDNDGAAERINEQRMCPLGSENEAEDNDRESDKESVGVPEEGDEEDARCTRRIFRRSKRLRLSSSDSEDSSNEESLTKKTKTKCKAKKTTKYKRPLPARFPQHCSICGIRHTSYTFYFRHKLAHDNPEYLSKFKCDKCKYVGRSKSMLHKHFQDAHGERHPADVPLGPYLCDKCDYVPKSYSHFERHMKAHEVTDNFEILDGDRWIRCKLCGLEDTKLRMYSHMRNVHSLTSMPSKSTLDDTPLLCHMCSKTFATSQNLKMHIRSIHENRKRFVCDTCRQGFMSKLEYADHLAGHKSLNILTCNECPLTFRSRNGLRRHQVQCHKPGQPGKPLELKVECKHCGLRLAHATALAQHCRTTHQELFIFRCDKCEAAYMKRDELRLHVNKKHSEQKYTCEHCCGQFNCRKNLTRHIRMYCKKKPTASQDTVLPCIKTDSENSQK